MVSDRFYYRANAKYWLLPVLGRFRVALDSCSLKQNGKLCDNLANSTRYFSPSPLYKDSGSRNKKYETDQFVLFNVVMKNIPLENMHGKNMARQIICSGYASQSPDEIRVDKNSLEYNAEGVLINIQVNHERNL